MNTRHRRMAVGACIFLALGSAPLAFGDVFACEPRLGQSGTFLDIGIPHLAMKVGEFGNLGCIATDLTTLYPRGVTNGWLYQFSSFVSVNWGPVQEITGANFTVIDPLHYTKPQTGTQSTVVRKDSDLQIEFGSSLSGGIIDPGTKFGGAEWDVFATLKNLTSASMNIRYYWYLDLEYAGTYPDDKAVMARVPNGFSMQQWEDSTRGNRNWLPFHYVDTYYPTRWEIADYSSLYDKLSSAIAPVDLAYADDQLGTTFGPYDITAAFQHDIVLCAQCEEKIAMTPMTNTVPEPAAIWLLAPAAALFFFRRR